MWKSRSWLLLLVLLACGLLWLWRALEAREGRARARGTNEFRDASARVDEGGFEPGRAVSATAEPAAAAQRVGGAIAGVLTLAVRVLDWNDDHPLAGASVTALEEEPPRLARTDAEGRCALVVRDVPERVRLRIEAEGYVPETDECTRRGPVEFGLSRAARVHGRVLAADTEEPIAGARIAQEFGLGERVVVESGADGSYALAEVPCGMTASVSLSAGGFATCTREFQLDPLAGDLEQDLHLARGAEVKGRVVDWESGAGLAGALVSGLEADADGRFAGRLLAAPGTARTRVEVTAEGHASLNAPVELGTGEELEFRLPRLAFVEGRVLDAAGQPLTDVQVYLSHRGPQRPDGLVVDTGPLSARPAGWAFGVGRSYTRTLTGDFRLPVLPWSPNVNLRASKDGFTDVENLARTGAPATTQTFELRLERARVAGARVWGRVSLNGCSSEVLRGTLAWRGPTRGGEVRFAGEYELVAEPGELELTVVLDDVRAHLEGASVRVQAREGERVWCSPELRAPGAAISGLVRFADGRPVAGAELGATCLARGKGCLLFTAQTNGRGEYSLAVPDIGQRFTVSVVSRLEHLERVDVAAGTTALDFVLPDLHPLLVRVVDAATGVPLRVSNAVRLAARASGADFEPVHVEAGIDMDGWTELWLAAERVDLLAQPADRDLDGYGLVVRRGIELRSQVAALRADTGVVPRVELRLERAAPLVLELDPKGAPWPDEHELALLEEELCDAVQLSREGWESKLHGLRSLRHVDFDEHGRAELAGFGPGRYRFQVFPADVALDPAEIVVERGGGLPVVVRWRRTR